MAYINFKPINQIKVGLCLNEKTLHMGRLAYRKKKNYFEYDRSFIKRGLNISPLKCPLKPGLQTFDSFLFEGLPGAFSDSLPDGWGRLLLDRKMRSMGIMPGELSPLDRLAYTGRRGMGALTYEPDYTEKNYSDHLDLDLLAEEIKHIFKGKTSDILEELLWLNSSGAGARPKIAIGIHKNKKKFGNQFEPWLVKFLGANDAADAGAVEYVYALMAKEAGVEMEEVCLLPGKTGPGYFATKRFDRNGEKRLHMHSASGLLHSDFRTPALDYENLMALTMFLTKDINEVEKMFRLAVFNVLAHNRDDHGKNFSFLMNEKGEWELSPAYDLTFSFGPGGEQSTMVMGEGNPGKKDLVKLGQEAKLPDKTIENAVDQTKAALAKWSQYAKEQAVSHESIKLIKSKININ